MCRGDRLYESRRCLRRCLHRCLCRVLHVTCCDWRRVCRRSCFRLKGWASYALTTFRCAKKHLLSSTSVFWHSRCCRSCFRLKGWASYALTTFRYAKNICCPRSFCLVYNHTVRYRLCCSFSNDVVSVFFNMFGYCFDTFILCCLAKCNVICFQITVFSTFCTNVVHQKIFLWFSLRFIWVHC